MREDNQKEFTKADLKDGMVVEQNNEERYLVMGDRLLCLDGYNPLTQYNDDLTNILGKEYHIERVFQVKSKYAHNLREIFDDENLELIWERKETKRMTAEEMRKKLEELTGEKIEIEPSREEMLEKIKEYCCGRVCRNCCIFADCEKQDCSKLDGDKLKQCYEKVMEDGNN